MKWQASGHDIASDFVHLANFGTFLADLRRRPAVSWR